MTTVGERHELARYQLPAGVRFLYGQRIDGRVAVSDVPDYNGGRVYLVERHVESKAALDGLLADYLTESKKRGEPAALLPPALHFDA
jgi:hypothetical protein